MEGSHKQHQQEQALRAVEMAAISDYLQDNRNLQESCLVICNSCRECVPLPYVKVSGEVPSTLLAVFFPQLRCAEGEGASRVLLPRCVLKVNWTFGDPETTPVVEAEGDHIEEDMEEGEDEEEEEEMQENNKEKEGERKTKGGEEEEEGETVGVERKYGVEAAFDIDMSKQRWPEGVKELFLGGFNRCIQEVVWPASLEVLSFHIPLSGSRKALCTYGEMGIFNRPLDRVTFPAGLREICFGRDFNQPIDAVTWPECLERLSMPGFNYPIHDVQWPSRLKRLSFLKPSEFEYQQSLEEMSLDRRNIGFDQPLGTFLPMSLRVLWLSNSFDQSLRGVIWPSGLELLGLGIGVTEESIDGVKWPPSLRRLVLSFRVDVEDSPRRCKVIKTSGLFFYDSHIEHLESYMDSWNDIPEYGDYDSLDEYLAL